MRFISTISPCCNPIIVCLQTFANDEGDDPSRVRAAADPLIEQLNTIIGFKDGSTGIAHELQCAATRSQNPHSERRNLLSAFRDISSWCDQFSLPKTIGDIYKRADEEKLLREKPLDAVIATRIFIACRQAQRAPHLLRDLQPHARV